MYNKVPKNEYLKGKPGKKKDAFKKDVIYDPRGQWAYPGEITRIPSGDITMQGVPYPVLGVDNLGYEQMMYPGLNYQFPGDTVTEYPQNKVFETEADFYRDALIRKRNQYWNMPSSGSGVAWPTDNMPTKSGPGPIQWPTIKSDYQGIAMMYGGDPSIPELTQAKKGGWLNKYQEGAETQGMTGSMKGAIAYGYMHGNPAAQRLVNPYTDSYIWTGNEPGAGVPAGNTGTHFMASMDNYAVPFIQQGPNGLYYNEMANPSNPEAMQFNTPEEAEYFAEHYKDVAPAFQKKGGNINKYSKLPKKTSSKNIKTSINKLMTKNPLFERNYMLYGAKGPRLYDPNSKYQTGGSVADLWTQTTGLNWSEAKSQGLTNGTYDANIALKQRLLNGEFGKIKIFEKPTVDAVNQSTNIPVIQASSFNEAFKSARETLGKNQIFEFNGRKYGTNLAGEEFTPSEETLKLANLNNKQTKERLREENKKVKSPYTNKNTVKLEPEYKSWEQVKKDQLDLNKNDQASLIVNFKSKEKTGKNYIIVDKAKGLLHIYSEGSTEPVYTSAIDLGKNPGDAQTVTKYKDLNNDGKINDADKVNGKFQVDWSAGNMSTGAGKYYISNIDPTGYEGLPILNMMNENQYDAFKKTGKKESVATSFHTGYIKDDQSRVSNGCIRCNKPTLDNLVKNIQNSNEVYILPEDADNAFVLENGKLNFKVKSKKNYNEYTDSKGIKRVGQGINRTVNTLNYRPIKLELDEKSFKANVFQRGDFDDEKEFSSTTKPFIKSLEANKQKIMKAAKVNGDVYNEIAKMTFGIYGTESHFGDTHVPEGNFTRAVAKYIDPKQSSSPDYKTKYYTYRGTENYRSVGLTQIRFSYLNDDEKKALAEVGITSNAQFLNPELAAMGTAVVLGVRYNQQLNQEEKENMWEYLPFKWNTRDNYGERVKNNSRYINIMQYDADVNKGSKATSNIKPATPKFTQTTPVQLPKVATTRKAFKYGGWLDSYQEGGAAGAAKSYKKLPSKPKTNQELFGVQPVATESTGVNKTPQAGLDLKNKTALGFHKAVQERVKANPNLSIEDAQSQLNAEWLYATGNAKGQGAVRQADPEQGLLSKTIEVAAHPFNALDAYVQSGYVPDYFSHNKDAVNPMDMVYGALTPAGWYTTGAHALYNKLPNDIAQGNWLGVAEDILMGLPLAGKIGSKALGVTSKYRSPNLNTAVDEGFSNFARYSGESGVPKQLPGSSNVGYNFPKYPLQSAETQVGIDPVHYRAVDAVKNNSDSYYNFVTETFEPGVKKSQLVNPQFGHDYVLPEGMRVNELNEFARRNQAGLIEPYQVNDVYESIVKLNPELKTVNINKTDLIHGVASHIAPQDLLNLGDKITPPKGFFGNFKQAYQEAKWKQFTNENEGFDFRFSPERQKEIMRTYKPTNTPTQLPGSPNVAPQQMGFFNFKGAFQKYPKGPLTQEEIAAYKNSDYYKQATKGHLDAVNKYGDRWNLPNYAEENLQEAILTGNRSSVNPVLYGGKNWGASDYIIAGLAGTAYPGYVGIAGLAFSPPAVKNKVLNAAGITSTPGVLSSQDTTINITNKPMDFAKVNEIKDGQIIIGGEFIEDANNTVRKAKDWLTAADTYSDKEYPSKDIQSFYGIENGKFKVGKASDFKPDTEIVPRRFGAINISKAVLNEGSMRLLDNQGNPIYQNTPNTGKFILYSPSTKEAEFNYINTGKSGVDKVNKFLKKNKDAQYIHLDNGRYEFYGLNPEGLSGQDFRDYYQQDLEREGNPGYNMIIKKNGGSTRKSNNWLNSYQGGGSYADSLALYNLSQGQVNAIKRDPNLINSSRQVGFTGAPGRAVQSSSAYRKLSTNPSIYTYAPGISTNPYSSYYHPTILPIGTFNYNIGTVPSGALAIPIYKKPVGSVAKSAPVETPAQTARELKPIESKLTPIEVSPEPALYKAPKAQPLYKMTQLPNTPPFYWQFDPIAKRWYQISAQAYSNAPANQKKMGGASRKSGEKLVNYSQKPNFVKTQSTNWLDKY